MAEEEKPPPEPDASLPGRAMMPPRVRFGHNAPPNDYISRDTPLVLEQTTATVPVSPTPVAGTAPSEIKATLVAAGHLVADAQTYGRGFAADTIANRRAVQALLEGTQAKIAELREERLNDPGTGELIDFLDWLAKGLSALVENLDRAIAEPASEPMFLGTAGEIAHQLHLGLIEATEKNRVRIIEIGACIGTACFLSWLSGKNIAELLSILFGVKK